MELSTENLSKFLPYYLTEERKKGLLEALRNVPNRRYYGKIPDPEPLQGDGWSGLRIRRFEDGAADNIKGVVLTNSCDLAAGNERLMPVRLNFAPLVSLDRYLGLLRANGIAAARVEQHAQDVRAQLISDLFYLPADVAIGGEHIALLHDIHTIPISKFSPDGSTKRIFSLSYVGFYLFIFKLSVHFCRMHEAIDRPEA